MLHQRLCRPIFVAPFCIRYPTCLYVLNHPKHLLAAGMVIDATKTKQLSSNGKHWYSTPVGCYTGSAAELELVPNPKTIA